MEERQQRKKTNESCTTDNNMENNPHCRKS